MGDLTERLYWQDSFLRRFEATIVRVLPAGGEAGGRQVVLDRTAFYPTGGGQPCDTGRLGGASVVEVREDDRGPLHVVSGPGAARLRRGEVVPCEVDWPRRFDHMQQHSGQHLLSRALVEIAGAPTRSFHLGETLCTIDVEMFPPDEASLRKAEETVNGIIWEDRPVTATVSSAGRGPGERAGREAGLAGLGPKPGEPVRTIEVQGFDATPCGGTHVSRTGQVGALAVTAWEPSKKMTRITFVCGGRVVRRLREARAVVGACVAGLSAPEPEVPGALRRLLGEREEMHRRLKALEERVAEWEAEQAASAAPRVAGWMVFKKVFDGREKSVEAAQLLVRKFVSAPGRLAVVAVREGGRATLMAARSAGDGVEVGPVVSELASRFGGRGGGSALQARAGALPAGAAAELVAEAAERLAAVGTGGR